MSAKLLKFRPKWLRIQPQVNGKYSADIDYCTRPLPKEFVMAVTREPEPTVRKILL